MIIFITHHKTGTVYLRKSLKNFCGEEFKIVTYYRKNKLKYSKISIEKKNKFFFRVKSPETKDLNIILEFYAANGLKQTKKI